MLGSLIRQLASSKSSRLTGPRRLHIGGIERRDGWEVLNAVDGDAIDHVGKADDLSRFADGSFVEIYASHVLEHLDFVDELQRGLKEWHRVLAEGGKLSISVPDMDALCQLFSTPSLSLNERFGVIKMIFGGHVDEHDYHKVGFNFPILAYFLKEAGFSEIVRVTELGIFGDTSRIVVHGVPISLNVTARKRIIER